jgi:hypothetical protein
VWLIGIYAIAFGVVMIAFGFRPRGAGKQLEPFARSGDKPVTGGAAFKA